MNTGSMSTGSINTSSTNTGSNHPLDRFLQQRIRDGNISSTTLVFTFFCDVVTLHGGEIWLGSIIHALAPLGITERLIRTSVFRLVRDGWLESRKQGRRSYYRLTQTGQNYYQRAANRIYSCNKPNWDGVWSLLFTALVAEEKRDALHRGLSWLGYGRMAAGVYALPCNSSQALTELLADLDIKDGLVHMQAKADDSESLKNLVLSRWKLDDLQLRYKEFIRQYCSAREALKNSKPADDHSMFLLRILLIHEYRRILLSDPELPAVMLPGNWEGSVARSLTAEIYQELSTITANWVNNELVNSSGNMKNVSSTMVKRFSRDCWINNANHPDSAYN